MRVLGNVFPGAFRLTIACFCSCVGTSSKFRTVGRGLVGRRGLVVEFIVELVEPNWLNPTGCTAPPHLWLMWDKVRTWFNQFNPEGAQFNQFNQVSTRLFSRFNWFTVATQVYVLEGLVEDPSAGLDPLL